MKTPSSEGVLPADKGQRTPSGPDPPAYDLAMAASSAPRVTGVTPRPVGIVRTSSADQIARYIRRLIFDGALRPGSRVPQDAIARDLGVSRIPVREALIALEREGWVTIELHRGAFINTLDEQAVHDHYELYGLIFGFAAQRALARSAADLTGDLGGILAELETSEDPGEVERLSLAFHGAIIRAAASPRIVVLVRAMSALVPGNFFAAVPEAVGIERRGLPAVLRALRRGDGDRAAAAYGRMMRRIGDEVVRLFTARGLFEGDPGH